VAYLLHRSFDPRRLRAAAASVMAVLLVGGCSTVDSYLPTARSFGVYKLDINQGNYITQDQVEKLKVGQSRQQVRAVLGTPLVTDVFHDNRWDYVYEFIRQGHVTEHRKFTVFFNEDKLARWEGDEMPPSIVEANRAAAAKSMREPKPADDNSFFGPVLRGIFGR
jgi:outer membrane protein assembly factor BamE